MPDTLYTSRGISLWLMSHNIVCLIISRKKYPLFLVGARKNFLANSDIGESVHYCGSLLPVFGVRVSVTFHLTCVNIIFSSVWVAEWPPFVK